MIIILMVPSLLRRERDSTCTVVQSYPQIPMTNPRKSFSPLSDRIPVPLNGKEKKAILTEYFLLFLPKYAQKYTF